MPPGGVLSTLLWNILFDELLCILNESYHTPTTGFADDAFVATLGVNIWEQHTHAQDALDKAVAWGRTAGLTFSHKKTVAILFTREPTPIRPTLYIGGEPIKYEESLRYLGVTLDSRLTFEKHITEKASKCKGMLVRLNKAISSNYGPSPRTLRLAYKSIIIPKLIYGCMIWGIY